jgi:hypothetical protein
MLLRLLGKSGKCDKSFSRVHCPFLLLGEFIFLVCSLSFMWNEMPSCLGTRVYVMACRYAVWLVCSLASHSWLVNDSA